MRKLTLPIRKLLKMVDKKDNQGWNNMALYYCREYKHDKELTECIAINFLFRSGMLFSYSKTMNKRQPRGFKWL